MGDGKKVYWWVQPGGLVHAIRDYYVSARDDVYLSQTGRGIKERKEPWEYEGG